MSLALIVYKHRSVFGNPSHDVPPAAQPEADPRPTQLPGSLDGASLGASEMGQRVGCRPRGRERVGQTAQLFRNPRRKLGEQRHQLGAHADPQEAAVCVAGVLGGFQLVTGQVGHDVGSAGVDHRADSIALPGRQDRQTAGPSAAQQAHQQRFGTIVRRVASGDHSLRQTAADLAQRAVPGRSRASLQIRAGRHSNFGHVERDVPLFCDPPRHLQLTRRLETQTVVHPMGDELESELASQEAEGVQHRGGVWPS